MRRALLLLIATFALAACSPGEGAVSTTDPAPATSSTDAPAEAFPVTVTADNGEVTVLSRPEAVVSLSSVATEMLFAIGAGDQVIAVDDQSNFPASAPMTDLSGFTPNVEAVLALEPDLVILSFDPGGVVEALEAAEVPSVVYGAAPTLDQVYVQIEALGTLTGNDSGAATLVEEMKGAFSEIAAEAPEAPEGTTYFHEIDDNLYTLTSETLFGEIYSMFGLENVADEADPDGFGYPQISAEFLVAADPDIIFLADSLYGESAETLAARPGWEGMSAIRNGNVVELDSDVASRWGPRLVDFARAVSSAVNAYVAGG